MAMSSGLFLLDSEELKWALSKHTSTNKLIAAAMLKFFQLENRYPSQDCLPPSDLLSALIQQLGIPQIEIKPDCYVSRCLMLKSPFCVALF